MRPLVTREKCICPRPQNAEFQCFQIPQVPPHIRTDAAHLWLPGVPPLQDWKARDGRHSQL